MTREPASARFARLFARRARAVRARRTLDRLLAGAAIGLGGGAGGGLVLWALRLGKPGPLLLGLGLGALGAALGALSAFGRRWSDPEVALYLDARLDTREALTTAVGCDSERDEPAHVHVLEQAASALERAQGERLGPRVFRQLHAAAPAALAGLLLLNAFPRAPLARSDAAAPGSSIVHLNQLEGLDRIEALSRLNGRTPEQEARLKELAERARKLRAALKLGLERREALSEIGQLRDGIAAEALHFGDRNNRAGLDAAVNALDASPALRAAKRALENGDLTAFDAEMQRLANRAERSDRDLARQALEDAAKAARAHGAPALADALDAERRLFESREGAGRALRELGESLRGKLSREALQDLKDFGETGDGAAGRRLADALSRALEGLTPEERRRLTERLAKRLGESAAGATPLSRRELEDLAKRLSSEESVEQLREALRELANRDPSDEARREQGLGDAERGAAEAERGLGALPLPLGGDTGDAAKAPPGKPGQGAASGQGGPGSHHDTGTGEHAGTTSRVPGGELRAKAQARIDPGLPMRGAALGRSPARAGETANQVGVGSLGSVGKTEVGAVDHADIPEEYREQIGRYFEP